MDQVATQKLSYILQSNAIYYTVWYNTILYTILCRLTLEHWSNAELTKRTPCVAITDEWCGVYCAKWCHQMKTVSVLLALCGGIHRLPVDSPHKGQWRGALTFSLICAWTNTWSNNRDAGWFETPSCPLWRHRDGKFGNFWPLCNGVALYQIKKDRPSMCIWWCAVGHGEHFNWVLYQTNIVTIL